MKHIDDAVSATQAALDHGSPGGSYEIVDERPVSFNELSRRLIRTPADALQSKSTMRTWLDAGVPQLPEGLWQATATPAA